MSKKSEVTRGLSFRGLTKFSSSKFISFVTQKSNNIQPNNIPEEEISMARADGFVKYLKSKLPINIKFEEEASKTLNKNYKEAREKKTLKELENVNIEHLKLSLEKESPEILKKLYGTFVVNEINKETLQSIISTIRLKNATSDLNDFTENNNNKESLIIPHSYITFDETQQLPLRTYISKSLTTIDFTDNLLGDQGVENLIKALNMAESNLYHLILSHNNISSVGAAHIANSPQTKNLKTLDLSHNKLGGDGFELLIPILEKSPLLSHLILSYNNISLLGNASITKHLQPNNLKTLDLSHNELEDNGFKHLILILEKSPLLSNLILSHNEISIKGAGYIVNFLKTHHLKILDLAHNTILRNGASLLLKSDNMPEKLNISYNNIVDLSPSYKEEMDMKSTIMQLLLNLLSKESKLEAIDISGNSIGHVTPGLECPKEISKNSSLREFHANGNEMNEKALTMLLNTLFKSSENLAYLDITGNRFNINDIKVIKDHVHNSSSFFKVKINPSDFSSKDLRIRDRGDNEKFTTEIEEVKCHLSEIEESTQLNIHTAKNLILFLLNMTIRNERGDESLNKKAIENFAIEYKMNSVLFKEILSKIEDPNKDEVITALENMHYQDWLYHPLNTSPILDDID